MQKGMQVFDFHELSRFTSALPAELPIVRGKVWPGEDKTPTWLIECSDFQEFCETLRRQVENYNLLAYDESILDEELLSILSEDLQRFAEEEGYGSELASKALSALRSHSDELFAVQIYAFPASSGPVLCVRWQTELAPFIFRPERLLSSDGLQRVRKLKTLNEV